MSEPPPPNDFSRTDLADARFFGANLRGARFVESDLSGAVFRGVELRAVDVDAPWLFEAGNTLLVNGVDVVPYVQAELERRFPGRADARAKDPEGLRIAWAAVEDAWAAAVDRAAAMPAGTVDVQVDGEWSFAQTLRHLILATDLWLRGAILHVEQPFHPIGLAFFGSEDEGLERSLFTTTDPPYAEVLEVRAERVAMVRELIAGVTPEELTVEQRNPWSPGQPETTLSCLHVILQEEWEHLRFALRDLDAAAGGERS